MSYDCCDNDDVIEFVREVFVDGKAIGRIGKDKWGYVHECYGCEMGGSGHSTEKEAEKNLLMDYEERR